MKNFLLALSLVFVVAPVFAEAEVEETLVRSEEEAEKALAQEAVKTTEVTETTEHAA